MRGIRLKKKLETLTKVGPDACCVRAIIQYPHPKHLERAQHRNDTNVVNHRQGKAGSIVNEMLTVVKDCRVNLFL